MKVPVQIEVNRTGYSVELEPGTPLLKLLWGTLHLTGKKRRIRPGKGR